MNRDSYVDWTTPHKLDALDLEELEGQLLDLADDTLVSAIEQYMSEDFEAEVNALADKAVRESDMPSDEVWVFGDEPSVVAPDWATDDIAPTVEKAAPVVQETRALRAQRKRLAAAKRALASVKPAAAFDYKVIEPEIASFTQPESSSYLAGTDALVGWTWGDVGKQAFGGLHTAGSVVLSVFGAGSVAKKLEESEAKAGLLPDWAHVMSDGSALPSPPSDAQQPADVQPTSQAEQKPVAVQETPQLRAQRKKLASARKALADAKVSKSGGYVAKVPAVPSFALDQKGSDMATTYLTGCDVLGAEVEEGSGDYDVLGGGPIPQQKKIPQKTGKLKSRPSKHRKVAGRAKNVLKKVEKIAANTRARAAQYNPNKPRTLVPLAPVVVKGEVCLGAAQSLTPKQSKAVEKHNKSIVAHKAAVDNAKKLAAVAEKKAAKLKGTLAKYNKIVAKTTKGGVKSTRVRGDEDGYEQILGELLGFGPGYTGIFDDHYEQILLGDEDGWAEVMGDEDGWAEVMGAEGDEEGGEETKIDASDIQFKRDGSVSKDDMSHVIMDLPKDAFVWDQREPFGRDEAGSYVRMYGDLNQVQGYTSNVDGKDFVRMAWEEHTFIPNAFKALYLTGADADPQTMARQSSQMGYGPLVGNPNRRFKYLQYAVNDGKWFWQSDAAPSWATKEADDAARLAAREAAEAEDAAKQAEAARLEQEKKQQEEAMAKQEAANALAESAANSQEKIAQQAQAAKQAEADLVQQQRERELAAQQAAADLEMGKLMAAEQAKQDEAERQLVARQVEEQAKQEEAERQFVLRQQEADLAKQAQKQAARAAKSAGVTSTEERSVPSEMQAEEDREAPEAPALEAPESEEPAEAYPIEE